MYSRILNLSGSQSALILGPRGTGKSWWLTHSFPDSLSFDLLESELFTALLASPQRLSERIPATYDGWVIIDEIQKIPALLDEVHRLIEKRSLKFVLTGSSARKLKKTGVNLLAGRALTYQFFPLTVQELGADFDLLRSLKYGHLPNATTLKSPKHYLASYVQTYLKEEIQQEGLTRNLPAFSRFLEVASFSQGALLNISTVARDCGVHRKVVEDYFAILRDTLISFELPVFAKKAKRRLIKKKKFYFFDVGVYQTLRPQGPLDSTEEVLGVALESLVAQEIRALNEYHGWGFDLYYWHTQSHVEVDFVLYGEKGIFVIEVKRSAKVRQGDLKGLRLFLKDYPMAKAALLYSGTETYHDSGIEIFPVEAFLREEMFRWLAV